LALFGGVVDELVVTTTETVVTGAVLAGAMEGVAVAAIPAGECTRGAVGMMEDGIAGEVVETGSAMEAVKGYVGGVLGLGVGGPNEE
jgi:hypothetical protein